MMRFLANAVDYCHAARVPLDGFDYIAFTMPLSFDLLETYLPFAIYDSSRQQPSRCGSVRSYSRGPSSESLAGIEKDSIGWYSQSISSHASVFLHR
jgi:hypothetical protein